MKKLLISSISRHFSIAGSITVELPTVQTLDDHAIGTLLVFIKSFNFSSWNRPDSLHKNFGSANTCRTPDFNFNSMSANSCGEHNIPWCYVKKEKTDDPRFEKCSIPDCSCSRTFLRYKKGTSNLSIPWNLTPWKSIVDPLTKVDAFLDLIDPWNENRPCSDSKSCPSMCKADKIRNKRSVDEYDEIEETVGQE